MKNLSTFIKEEMQKMHLLEDKEYIYINNFDEAECAVASICCGNLTNIVFSNSSLKKYFIDKLVIALPDANIINCNCSQDRFNENNFDGLLVFNNILQCKHQEILDEIKNYKGVFIC